MWRGTATAEFKMAQERERELSPRQVEVLRLIERGHTNREIAEKLGISIDGAKWNVSEILTKLGLDSREDAAEYWRWRRGHPGSLRARSRAILTAPFAKWAAGGVAAVAGAAGLLAMLGNDSPPPPSVGVTPFYLEATETVARTKETSVSQFRWWYQDSDRYRMEYEQLEPWHAADTTTSTADGTTATLLNTGYREFMMGPVEPLPAHQRVRPTPVIMIGPAPAGTVAGVIEVLSHWGEGSQWVNNGTVETRPAPPAAKVVGRATLLGRDVDVIEYAYGTIWLEPTSMVVLKHVSEQFTVEVTRYEEHPAMPQGLFVQQAPPGVKVSQVIPTTPMAPPSSLPTVTTGTSVTRLFMPPTSPPREIDFGMDVSGRFRPTYLPGGYSISEGFGGANPSSSYGEWVARPVGADGQPSRDGDYISIGQRNLDEMPAVLARGEPFRLRGNSGFRTTGTDELTVSWHESGIIIHLRAPARVGMEELLRIAEGLELVP